VGRVARALSRHPLFKSLFELRGNQRSCVFTEPLFGIPWNLYMPYATLYMYALGIGDRDIGLLLSLTLLFQVVTAVFGGVLTDKFGRRKITFLIPLFAWSTPCLLWAFAQDFTWFVVAAAFNSMWQITFISWNLLLGEDCDPDRLVDVYTWVYISGLLAVFFAPLSALLVGNLGILAAVRILYLFAFAVMTTKFILLLFISKETARGKQRMAETKGKSIFFLLRGYGAVIPKIFSSPRTIFLLCLIVASNMTTAVSNTFFGIYVTQSIGLPAEWIAYFPMARALVMLVFMFVIQHRFGRLAYRGPMLAALALYIGATALLLAGSAIGIAGVVCYVVLEASAISVFGPLRDSLMLRFVDPEERARITSALQVFMLGVTAPFGYLAGLLSEQNRMLPFVFNIIIFALCGLLIGFFRPEKSR